MAGRFLLKADLAFRQGKLLGMLDYMDAHRYQLRPPC